MGRKPNRPGAQSGASGRSVTIKDLAAELGLSITTISRALNGYPDVGEKTRKRISEVLPKTAPQVPLVRRERVRELHFILLAE